MRNRLFRSAAASQNAGFTMIEIVMALILLGILGGVALAKYFDLQEQAAAKKCQYHRSLIVKTLYQRWALEKIDGTGALFGSDLDSTINAVMTELGGDGCTNSTACEKLCASGGEILVTHSEASDDSGVSFAVKCSVHGGDVITTPVDADKATVFQNWLGDYYEKEINKGSLSSLDKFFTKYTNGVIDSEAADFVLEGSYGVYKSMAASLKEALKEDGIDTTDTIWRVTRSGYCTKVQGPCGYVAEVTVTIAKKTADMKDGDTVDTYVYTSKITYNDNTWNNQTNKWDAGTVKSNDALPSTKGIAKVQAISGKNKDGKNSSYLVLR